MEESIVSVIVKPDGQLASRGQQPVANLLEVISRAASDPTVDVEKMERLMAMHERVTAKQAEAAFNHSMTACQEVMRPISADAENPQTRSLYASYAQLDKKLRPIYTKHGFSLSFSDGETSKPDYVRVVCKVRHDAGHAEIHWKDMPADGKGAKGGDVMTKTHASGAAQTYGMRYLLKGIFNVAIGEDDTDGNEPEECINEDQVANLQALITEVKANRANFLKVCKVACLEDLPVSKYSEAVRRLEEKRKQS
jgi:hypothetical protein